MRTRRRIKRSISLVVLALAAFGSSGFAGNVPRVAAGSVLVVQVGDAANGAFIKDAQVRLPSVGRLKRTAWNGEASFDGLSSGSYRVQVRALGYAPGDIEMQVRGDTSVVTFNLERLPPTLDTVRVQAEFKPARGLAEFEMRRRTGIGHFLTDSAITEHRGAGTQLMLVNSFPGLYVDRDGRAIITRDGPRFGNCSVLFYLDGFQLGQSLPDAVGHQREAVNLDNIKPSEIAGIEVYTPAEAPPQYRPLGKYCRVVLLWTKW